MDHQPAASGSAFTRFVVICLTLTATSDYQTASMVPLPYNIAASCFLAAFGCGLLWLRDRKRSMLIASTLLLAISLWNMDVGIPAVPFAMFVFVWLHGRRSKSLLVAWTLVRIAVVTVEWTSLTEPKGYPASP